MPKTLERWQSLAESAGDLSEARDHAGAWDKVMEILEQADEILGDTEADLKTYSMLVSAGLEDIRLGAIPPSLDQVLIGALDRSRQPDCRVTFLIGAILEVPRRQSEDTVSQTELCCVSAYLLEPDSRLAAHEQYLVYMFPKAPRTAVHLLSVGRIGRQSAYPSHD